MTRKWFGSTAAVGLGMLILSAPPVAAEDRPGEQKQAEAQQAAEGQKGQQKASIDELTRDWPEASRKAAKAMEQKYGAPDGVTDFRLTWQDKGPWKEIILDKQEIPHKFPKPHTDVLLQSVEYQVPPDKFDELAEYDGSIIVERTKGTMAARCDKEEMNFLALNLAHEIITGNKSVEEARDAYAHTVKQVMKGEKPEYTTKLAFQPQPQAGDTDVAVLQPQPGQPGEAQPAAEQQPAQREQRDQPAPQR